MYIHKFYRLGLLYYLRNQMKPVYYEPGRSTAYCTYVKLKRTNSWKIYRSATLRQLCVLEPQATAMAKFLVYKFCPATPAALRIKNSDCTDRGTIEHLNGSCSLSTSIKLKVVKWKLHTVPLHTGGSSRFHHSMQRMPLGPDRFNRKLPTQQVCEYVDKAKLSTFHAVCQTLAQRVFLQSLKIHKFTL